MRILFDNQAFVMQKTGGISRYFYELICGINNLPDVQCLIPLKFTNNEYMLQCSDGKGRKIDKLPLENDFLPNVNFKWKRVLYRISNKFIPGFNKVIINENSAKKSLREQEYDIFHPTYYNPYFLELIGKKPFVLTAHDLIHEIFPYYFPETDRAAKWKSDLFNKASQIIAISASTKKDLIRIYGINEKRINVVHHATSISEITECRPVGMPHGRYVLFVGNRTIYKNFILFLNAMQLIFSKDDDLKMICTGNSFTHEELAMFHEMGLENKVFQIYVTDSELKYLYQNARAFVFPSLYEGFGIPILEAFACGCPAIISNGSSMNEVGGDAACYFDPKDKYSLSDALEEVLCKDSLRKELILKGYERVKQFSWKKTVEKVVDVYRNVVGKKC